VEQKRFARTGTGLLATGAGEPALEALFFLERGMEKSPGRFVVAGLPLGDISWELKGIFHR